MTDIFLEENIQITDEILGWREAIRKCAQPLLEGKYIEEKYIDSMIKLAEEMGPFFDFGKNIAVPHSRPENGVNKKGVSLLKVNKPVKLLDLEDHPIDIFIVLAAEDNTSHLNILSVLANTLVEDSKVEKLKKSTTKEEIIDIFKS